MKKSFKDKIKDIKKEVKDFSIYKNLKDILKKSEKERILREQFLIEDEKNNLIISGGGRVMLFLILDKGSIKKEIDWNIKKGTLDQIKDILIFKKALKVFNYKIDYKVDPNKILEDKT